MKKALKRITSAIYYYKNSIKIEGAPSDIRGNLTGIRGDLSGISGDLSGIRGDLTGISGDLTGISGDLTGCEITAEERAAGIKIEELIED